MKMRKPSVEDMLNNKTTRYSLILQMYMDIKTL